MASTPPTALATLPSAFAAACRLSRTEGELFERCRVALVRRFQSELIWLTPGVSRPSSMPRVGPPEGFDDAAGGGPAGQRRDRGRHPRRPVGGRRDARGRHAARARPQRGARAPEHPARAPGRARRRGLPAPGPAPGGPAALLGAFDRGHRAAHPRFHGRGVLRLVGVPVSARGRRATRPRSSARSTTGSARPRSTRPRSTAPCRPGSAATGADDVAVAALVGPGAELVVPLDAGAERMAVLVLGSRISDKLYGRAELELAGTLSFAAAIALKNSELVEQLHSAATTDELTGLYNRRALEERLAAEISRSLRHQLHTSVLLLDLDRFKVINDTMGHAAGDRLLIQVAKSAPPAVPRARRGRPAGRRRVPGDPPDDQAERGAGVRRPGAGEPRDRWSRATPSSAPVRSAWASPSRPATAPPSAACSPRPTRRCTRPSAAGRNTVEVADG